MTVQPTYRSTAARAIPRPRSAQPDTTDATTRQEQLPVAAYPWPEPWHFSRGARPRSEFWDVATASWHSRGPYPERFSAG